MSFEDELAAALNGVVVNTDPATGGTPYSLGALSNNQTSGRAILTGILRSVGLNTADAADYITNLITGGGSISDWSATLTADLYDPNSIVGGIVKQKYPAVFAHNEAAVQKGKPTMTIGEYLSTKQQNEQIIEASGLSPYVDKSDLADKWITGFTSPVEAKARIDAAQRAVFDEPVEVRSELQRMFGTGDSLGAATAFFLDPTNAVPKIQQQLQAGEIGGASVRAGFGLLTAGEATALAQQGVNAGEAQAGFTKLGLSAGLFNPLPGESDPAVTREQQLGAAFGGNAAAQQEIERRRAARLAVFGSGSGGFSPGQRGVAGLGSASTP